MSRPTSSLAIFVFCSAGVLADEPFRYPEGKHGKGELKYVNGLPVLVVAGTPEEMGEQIGILGVKPVAKKMDGLVRKLIGPAWPLVVRACDSLYRRFPPDYQSQVEAMAKSSGIDRDTLIVANAIADVQHLAKCSVLVIEPSRSATGQMLVGRNWDNNPIGDLPKLGLVIIERPAGKHAFAAVSFPGLLISASVMNDAGLTLASNDVIESKDGSPRFNIQGTPGTVGARRLMEECANLDDADKLLKTMTATVRANLILCDRKGSVVYEITPKTVSQRRGNNGICVCTNHFLSPGLSTDEKCWRYSKLMDLDKRAKFSVDDVAKAMQEVSQGKGTIQSMIFEPSPLRMHVSLGEGPAKNEPYKALDCAKLLGVQR
jgi:hypothetical protein